MHSKTVNQKGFTLLEILIALAILVLLVTIGSVSYQSFSNDTNSRAAVSTLHSSLVLARIEAIKRGGWVRVCGSNNGDQCNSDFSEGWIVYHDRNNDETFGTEDAFISRDEIRPSKVNLSLTTEDGNDLTRVDFNHRGFTLQAASISATKGNFEQALELNRIGRIIVR